jgi:GABA permease
MAWKRNILVVANVTATSRELLDELCARAEREPTSCTLVVPATPVGGGRAAATETLATALERMREAGLEADGAVGAPDPIVAVTDTWDPKRYDEIIVSTLPSKFSKWLHAGLPERVGKLTGAPVSHVVSAPPRPTVASSAPPPHEDSGMGPLSVLGWGGQRPSG